MDTKKTNTKERLEKILTQAIQDQKAMVVPTTTKLSPAQKSSMFLNYAKYPTYKMGSPLKKYLPYSLNYKKVEKLSVLLLISFILPIVTPKPSEASRARPSGSLANLARLNKRITQTEAGALAETCTDCRSRAPQSSLSNYLSQLPIVRDGYARVQNVGIYERDRRQAVMDLRNRNVKTLTPEEKLVLNAAPKIGDISCSTHGTNGSLIQLEDGSDAILTSAHPFVDKITGKPLCDLTKMSFMPNATYYKGGEFDDFMLAAVETNGALPLNLENTKPYGRIVPLENDFLIFVLAKKISDDMIPDPLNSKRMIRRGSMKIASSVPTMGQTILMGYNKDFREGLSASYEACNYNNAENEFYHDCATTNTSSSSVMTVIENNELVVVGLHSRSQNSTLQILPKPENLEDANHAVSINAVKRYLKKHSLASSGKDISI